MKKTKKNVRQTDYNNGPPEMDLDYFSPIEVKVYSNFEKAFRSFRTLVQSEKVLSLYKEKQAFEKPSDKKRRRHNEVIKQSFDAEIKQKKILSGEYEKEKIKKQLKKEKRQAEREAQSSYER